MSKVKKFSSIVSAKMVSESADTEKGQAAVEALIKKMGYNSIEELKREKTLISKLENLMKEFSPKTDISEDEAEDIEDATVKMGKPKSLEGEAGKKEEGGQVGTEEDEVTEDEAEDIEDETVKMGEPDDKSSELKRELEDKEKVKGKEIAKRNSEPLKISKRILSFDEFIGEETINKNVSYQDDEKEDEDNAVPVAASYQHKGGKSVNEAEIEGKRAGNIIKKAEAGKKVIIGDNTYICLGQGKWKNVNTDEKLNWIQLSAMASALGNENVIIENFLNEAEISSADEFKEYATKMLKNAFGTDFDEVKANDTIDGLISKYKNDFGAMVGALQSSMG